MSLIKKTSILSDSRFPSFIRGNPEFDMLRRFIKSYFESIEEVGKPNYELLYARENTDVDTVTSEFLDKFYSSLCPELPINILADKRLLLKHSRELYQKKGTPDSFKLLFKLLYNEVINIKYPSENILRTSDGKWNQTVAIHVVFPEEVSEKTIIGLVGQEITITKKTGIIRNVVTQIRKIAYNNVYEVTLDKQKNLLFEVGDTVSIGGIACSVLPSTQSIKILKQGRNFKIGQIIKLDIDDRVNNISLAKITDVTSIGGIKSIKIIKFGSGYNADFNLTIFADTNGVTNVAEGDFEGGILPYKESTNGYKEFGTVSKVGSYGDIKDYFLQDYIVEDYISTPYSYFYGTTQTSSTYSSANDYFLEDYILGDYTTVFNPNDIDAYAILSINVGAILSYPGFFSNINGSLSNPLICLQDNHLYQNFSYVIQSSVSRNKFSDVVKNLLHPAGMLMFSDLLLENTFNVSNSVSDDTTMVVNMAINEKIVSDDRLSVIQVKELFDEFSLDSLLLRNIETNIYDTVSPIEYDGYYQNGYVDIDYSFGVDGILKNISQKKYDQLATSDDFDSILGITVDDVTPVVDYLGFGSAITNTDTITTTDIISNNLNTQIAETVGTIDSHNTTTDISPEDVITAVEDLGTGKNMEVSDNVTVTDNVSGNLTATLSDVVGLAEISSYVANGYSEDGYFAIMDGFSIKVL